MVFCGPYSGASIILRYACFLAHYACTAYILYPFSSYNSILATAVYVSWMLNHNYCILSQVEYRLFKQTCWSKILRPVSRKEKYFLLSSQCVKILYNICICLPDTRDYLLFIVVA